MRAQRMMGFCRLALRVLVGVGAVNVGQAMAVPTHLLDSQPQWIRIGSMGLSVDFPSGIFTVDAGPSDKGPGRLYRSGDGSAGFMYWVEPNSDHETPAVFLKNRLKFGPEEIDYQRVTNRFVVVSGVRNGSVYYSRCNFPSGVSGPIHCLYMVYDAREKPLWDSVVTRVSLSLR
jgi:hypothetical protein